MITKWINATGITPRSYFCAYCETLVSSDTGYVRPWGTGHQGIPLKDHIYICPGCDRPTFFDLSKGKFPESPFGKTVQHISSKDVENLYQEARNCTGVSAYTCAVLACRKLLMNIAVDKGAPPQGLTFKQCVDFLDAGHYIPRDCKAWVDHIREKGNEATHEIALMAKQDAEELITFVEMLLKLIYEYPEKIKQGKP